MTEGWQPAVDNLQSQINSIDSQIATLSGQESSQATQLALVSSQLSSLQTEVSAIQQQVARGNTLADLSGASVSLSNPNIPPGGQYTAATLNGSTAVLSIPTSSNIDGKLFKLSVVARVSDDGASSETDFGGTIVLGDSLSGVHIFGMSGTGIGLGVYSFEVDCIWDSVTQFVAGYCIGGGSSRSGSGNSNGSIGGPAGGSGILFRVPGISSQTGIKFVFGAYWNNTSNPASVVFTQFKLSLI